MGRVALLKRREKRAAEGVEGGGGVEDVSTPLLVVTPPYEGRVEAEEEMVVDPGTLILLLELLPMLPLAAKGASGGGGGGLPCGGTPPMGTAGADAAAAAAACATAPLAAVKAGVDMPKSGEDTQGSVRRFLRREPLKPPSFPPSPPPMQEERKRMG